MATLSLAADSLNIQDLFSHLVSEQLSAAPETEQEAEGSGLDKQSSTCSSPLLIPGTKIKALKQPREADTEPAAWLGAGQGPVLWQGSPCTIEDGKEDRCHGDCRAA